MDAILRIVPLLVALFVIVNGIYLGVMPPSGDEFTGAFVVAAGLVIIIAVLAFPRVRERFGRQ